MFVRFRSASLLSWNVAGLLVWIVLAWPGWMFWGELANGKAIAPDWNYQVEDALIRPVVEMGRDLSGSLRFVGQAANAYLAVLVFSLLLWATILGWPKEEIDFKKCGMALRQTRTCLAIVLIPGAFAFLCVLLVFSTLVAFGPLAGLGMVGILTLYLYISEGGLDGTSNFSDEKNVRFRHGLRTFAARVYLPAIISAATFYFALAPVLNWAYATR